jgi:hypothetical protein
MKLNRRTSTWLLINVVLCTSCSFFDKETTQTRVHYFSKADTAFLFPDEYRDTGYSNRDFEQESKWLRLFDERKLFDDDSLKQYIRLSYWRSSDDALIIRFEKNKSVIKTAELNSLETRYDSTAMTKDEWELLKAYNYHTESIDSNEIRKQLLTRFPDLKNNLEKVLYLEFIKSQVPKDDSIVFTEKKKFFGGNILNAFLLKLDSINFWSMDREYYQSDTDGSSFVIEAKNGNKYRSVKCTNCVLLDLIYMRNDLLKFTDLKKDRIY